MSLRPNCSSKYSSKLIKPNHSSLENPELVVRERRGGNKFHLAAIRREMPGDFVDRFNVLRLSYRGGKFSGGKALDLIILQIFQ